MQVASEGVETATVAENDTKKANDGDNVSESSGPVEVVKETKCDDKMQAATYSNSSAKSEDEEEVYNNTSKKTDEADADITGGLQLYQLTQKDKTQFTNKVNRHASSLTLTFRIMLAISKG